jgi:hypothetical protein
MKMNKAIPTRFLGRVGDRLLVKASEFLGTPAAMSTVVEVTDFGYLVNIDGDEPEWFGPVTFDGDVLIERPDVYEDDYKTGREELSRHE